MPHQVQVPDAALAEALAALDKARLLAVVEGAARFAQADLGLSWVATVMRANALVDEEATRFAGPARKVHGSLEDAFDDIRILTEARRAVLDVPMLTSAAVAQALGQKGKNTRDAASKKRSQGALVGVPNPEGRGYLYPAFQVDPANRRVHPVVERVNTSMGAERDPWGVASWWVTPTPRLHGLAPMEIVGQARESDLLVMRGLLPPSAAHRLQATDEPSEPAGSARP